MRRAFLLRSINRILGDDVVVHDAAYMWARHRWVVPFATAVFAAAVLLAPIAGLDEWPTRIVIGAGIMAVSVTAATEYRVLALIDGELALFAASRIRQVATALQERYPGDVELSPVGGTILAADWQVGGRRYTVPRSSEQAMERIAASRRG